MSNLLGCRNVRRTGYNWRELHKAEIDQGTNREAKERHREWERKIEWTRKREVERKDKLINEVRENEDGTREVITAPAAYYILYR